MPRNELIIYGVPCAVQPAYADPNDKDLIEFSETIKKLPAEFEGLKVTRAGLAFNPLLFSMNREVLQLSRKTDRASCRSRRSMARSSPDRDTSNTTN